MRINKKILEKIEKWIEDNGACDILPKEENIHFYNGGLFQDINEDYAELWIGDLDDMIRYLRRLKSFLNKLGFNTRQDMESYFIDKKNGKKNNRIKNSRKK